jgi:hypothetical protein
MISYKCAVSSVSEPGCFKVWRYRVLSIGIEILEALSMQLFYGMTHGISKPLNFHISTAPWFFRLGTWQSWLRARPGRREEQFGGAKCQEQQNSQRYRGPWDRWESDGIGLSGECFLMDFKWRW